MTTTRSLGIWMDHAVAHLMEFTASLMETVVLTSEFTHQVQQQSLHKGERLMHNKEQQQQAAYYKKLGEIILHYEHVLLFGPTDAKVELFHFLQANPHFEHIQIAWLDADKMTDNQEHAFVRDYFLKPITPKE